MMDRNKIVSFVFWFSLLAAILFGVYRFFIARDFLVVYQIDCDPTVENCFVGRCDPSFDECTGNEEEDIWYYAKVKKMAYDVARCNPQKEECPDESVCDRPIEQKCWIEKCNENNLEEGEECIDPETYLMQHPEALEEENSDESAEEGIEEEGAEVETVEGESEEEPEATEEVPTEESPENLAPNETSAAAQPTPVPENLNTEKTETVVPY